MTDIELICFQMISALGQARSSFMEALKAVQEDDFEKAEQLIEEGTNYRVKGHDVHFQLLQKESQGEATQLPLLLVHAEDQLMSSEVLEVLAKELLATHRKLNQFQRKEEA